MNKEEFTRICRAYAESEDFILNPDIAHLEHTLNGILKMQEKTGLRYCPCRLLSGNPANDADLLCPCHFQIQGVWEAEGRCWCGLFVKRP